MSDFGNFTGVANDAVTITPDDNADLPGRVRALLFLTAGTVRIRTLKGQDITLNATFPVGYILPIGARRVFATSTTATLVGLI